MTVTFIFCMATWWNIPNIQGHVHENQRKVNVWIVNKDKVGRNRLRIVVSIAQISVFLRRGFNANSYFIIIFHYILINS